MGMFLASAFAGDVYSSSHQPTAEEKINSQLEVIFNHIEQVGNSYNNDGSEGAMRAALSALCNYGFSELSSIASPGSQAANRKASGLAGTLGNKLMGSGTQASISYANSACFALVNGGESGGLGTNTLSEGAVAALAEVGLAAAKQSGLPFLSRMQASVGIEDGEPYVSALTVQPLWEDKQIGRFLFNQTSLIRHDGDFTFNTGLALRQLMYDDTLLVGGNIFFDHTFKNRHNRISLGVDARTATYGIAANRYIPITEWRSISALYEERAMPGWDLRVDGTLESLPNWNGFLRGYTWESMGRENDDIYGVEAGLSWSPFPSLSVTGSLIDENNADSIEGRIALTYTHSFGDVIRPNEASLTPLSVADQVYHKVERENFVRVEQRRKNSTYLTVAETIGVNSVTDENGVQSLSTGLSILMPATVTVANSVGALTRLSFKDGAYLTIAQGSTASIDVDRITLLSAGAIQYVSGSTSRTVSVPGGTIVLMGTDIDVVSDGSNTTARVRDGAIRVSGNVAGSLTLPVTGMGRIASGVVSTVAAGSADYVAHTTTITNEIDWQAQPIEGGKIAPYTPEPPALVSQSIIPGQMITMKLHFNQSVSVTGGTPQLMLTVGGVSRTAPLVSGSGSEDLVFGYVIQSSDAGVSSITVEGLDNNGANIMGSGKEAVTTIVPTTLALSSAVGDSVSPSGYSASFLSDPVLAANVTAGSFRISGAEIGTTYAYSITDGASHTVSGSGTVTAATQDITGLNLTTLNDGTITLSLTLTDASSNAGSAVTDTATKDASAPSGYSVAFTTDPVNDSNKTAAAFTITGAEVGTTYSYTITDGLSATVTGSGTIATASQNITGINVSSLVDGTLTLSLTLEDGAGNAGAAATDTVTKDSQASTGYGVAITSDPINNSNKTAFAFTLAGAEVGSTYNYTISDSASGTVTGSGTVATATQNFSGINVSALAEGTLTLSFTLTDVTNNVGAAVTDTVTKDTGVPAGYSVNFLSDPVLAADVATASFRITGAEVGTTYAYTITDSASGSVTGTAAITSATQDITGINLSSLADGTLTLSLKLTDAAGNAGAFATDTVTKDAIVPTGYSVLFTTDPVNAGNKAAAAFTISGAEVGTTYAYTISDSASGTVAGSATVSLATQPVTGLDLTALAEGTLTVSVTLTDTAGNAGAAVTDTVAKDTIVPTITSVTAPANGTYGP